MAANDAFTAGVRPGGLTNSTEIRLLLCYLVKNAGPITRTEIENALMEEALVNYFEIGSCLDDIARQQLVTADGDRYTITDKGRKVAQELAYDLPRSVREKAVAAVLGGLTALWGWFGWLVLAWLLCMALAYGTATAVFTPAASNAFYHYTEDTPLYVLVDNVAGGNQLIAALNLDHAHAAAADLV